MPNTTSEPKRSVLDVTTATFEQEVILRSREAPVLVDFWATWCGPCRTLSPILERLAGEAQSAWILAKVDIDCSPDLASAFGIQSVPTVVVVKDGKVVDGFLGAQPEAKIREMIARHVVEAVDAIQTALDLERTGKPGEAIAVLRDRAKADRTDAKARAQLARLLALAGALGETELLLDALPEPERDSEPAIAARAILAAQDHVGDIRELEQAVASEPQDIDARLKLGRALVAASRFEEALPALFEAARREVAFRDGEPRKALQEAFAALGEDHPLTTEYRRKLSVLLCG